MDSEIARTDLADRIFPNQDFSGQNM